MASRTRGVFTQAPSLPNCAGEIVDTRVEKRPIIPLSCVRENAPAGAKKSRQNLPLSGTVSYDRDRPKDRPIWAGRYGNWL